MVLLAQNKQAGLGDELSHGHGLYCYLSFFVIYMKVLRPCLFLIAIWAMGYEK